MTENSDDQLVWSLHTGRKITASRDLLMEGSGERTFTNGKTYVIESMHPIVEPPFVRVRNDQGDIHALTAEDLRNYFGF